MMIPGLVTIEFVKDTTDSAGNPKRSTGDRLMVDQKQAEAFVKKGAAKIVADESKDSPKHSLPAAAPKPDAPASGVS